MSSRRAASTARPKLLAVDLDGTLLDAKTGSAHTADLAALRALAESGVAVSIVTGRLYSGTRPSVEAIGLTGPVACVDGSHIVAAADHATLVHHAIRGADARQVRDAVVASNASVFLFARDAITHDDRGSDFIPYVSLWSSDIRKVDSVADADPWASDDGVTAVVAVGSRAEIAAAALAIDTACGAAVQVASFALRRLPDRWGMIARASQGTKGSALAWIAKHHGLDMAETVCVGDWFNDVPMLAVAGRAFAMAQAPDVVKEVATHVLAESGETGGGVARVVKAVFGVEPG